MRAWLPWAFGILVGAACADAPLPEPRAGQDVEVSKAPPLPLIPSASPIPAPVLPPLARDARPPCEVARARRARAAELLEKSRAYRALRELSAAERLCPTDAREGWKARLGALVLVGRVDEARSLARVVLDAPAADADAKKAARDVPTASPGPRPTGAATLASANAAKARGDGPEARRLFDQALARLEQESSATASLVWGREIGAPLALSADGATAVLARGKLAVLSDATRLAPRRFFDHEREVHAAALSRDGRLLGTVDAAGDAFLWAAATGRQLRKLAWANEPASALAFTSDGKRVVVVGAPTFKSSVRVWSTETGDSMTSFEIENTSRPTFVALSRDDRLAAFGSERGHLELWSLGAKPARAFVLANKESFLESSISAAFSPKGDRLAAVFENGAVGVWETATGKPVWSASSSAPFLTLGACAFSPDAKRLFVGWQESSAGGSLRVWDAATGAELQNRPVPGRAVAFSEDAKRGLLEESSTLAVLDVDAMTTSIARSTHMPSVEHVLFGPPRVLAVDLERDEGLRVVLPAGLRSLPLGDSFRMVVPSFDGKEVAVSIHGEVTLWDLEAARPREKLAKLDFFPDSIALAPDRTVRASDTFGGLTLVASDAGRTGWKKRFEGPRGDRFPKLTLSNFGQTALLWRDKELTVLDAESGAMRPIQHGLPSVDGASLSPDGRVVWIGGGGALHRFDAASGARVGAPVPFNCRSRELRPAFDGSRVASVCANGARVVSFGQGGAEAASLDLPMSEEPRDVALAPHGDLLVSAHEDGRLRIWRVDGGRLLATLRFLPGRDAALLETEGGGAELLGASAPELAQELTCRVGADAYPFELCSEALLDEGLLAEILAPR